MINSLLSHKLQTNTTAAKEGDLYKTVTAHKKTFHLYYGYYEECERSNPSVEPMPIYPDFIKDPQHTDEGLPFVTKMQDACKYYIGKIRKHNECAECQYYRHGDDLIGVCTCKKNTLTTTETDG